jgi:hypothetical protein
LTAKADPAAGRNIPEKKFAHGVQCIGAILPMRCRLISVLLGPAPLDIHHRHIVLDGKVAGFVKGGGDAAQVGRPMLALAWLARMLSAKRTA